MTSRRLAVAFASGIDESAAQLVHDQRAPMQVDRALVVEVDQQAASGSAEQRVGVGDDRDHRASACEDFAIKVGAETTQRPTAARLVAAVPGLHGRLQDASLVAHLLVQRDAAGFDAGHDVRTGHAE